MVTTKKLPRRDARGRFIARPMFRIGEQRIGVSGGEEVIQVSTRTRRRGILALVLHVLVALFSVKMLARSWGAP